MDKGKGVIFNLNECYDDNKEEDNYEVFLIEREKHWSIYSLGREEFMCRKANGGRCERMSKWGECERWCCTIVDDILKMTFEAVEEADSFYYMYSRTMGFNVRKGDQKKNKNGVTRYRKWLCDKQGTTDPDWLDKEGRVRGHKCWIPQGKKKKTWL